MLFKSTISMDYINITDSLVVKWMTVSVLYMHFKPVLIFLMCVIDVLRIYVILAIKIESQHHNAHMQTLLLSLLPVV